MKLREQALKYGPRFFGCMTLRGMGMQWTKQGLNGLGTTRNFPISAEMQEQCVSAELLSSNSKLWLVVQYTVEAQRILKRGSATRQQAQLQLRKIFGYVPQIFGCMQEASCLRGYASMLEILLRTSTMPLPLHTRCQVLALTAYSYNCYYLTAIFTTLAAHH